MILAAFLWAHAIHRTIIVGLAIRSTFLSLIYKRSTTITSTAQTSISTGYLVNLMSTDAQRFVEIMFVS